MKKRLIVLCLLLSGCVLRSPAPQTVADPMAAEGGENPAEVAQAEELPDVAPESVSERLVLTDPVSDAVADMVLQLNTGLKSNRVQRLPMAVLPFVDLRDPRVKGPVGERFGESFLFQLEQNGYNLVDYRAVSLTTTAKAPLSKGNLSGLRSRYRIYFILTGTYARYPDGIVLNARVLDTTTRQVLATAQSHISNTRLEGALPGYDPLKVLQQGMIIENAQGAVGQ